MKTLVHPPLDTEPLFYMDAKGDANLVNKDLERFRSFAKNAKKDRNNLYNLLVQDHTEGEENNHG